MVLCASAVIYSDDLISATELNRRSGEVLDRAWDHPVTIARNERAFALLRRESVAELVKAATQTRVVVEVINVAFRLRLGENISSEHPYGWLKAFDTEELGELISEILSAFHYGVDAGNWDILEAVIHEWHESALAISSPELAAAFSDEIDEVPLTQPSLEPVIE